MAFRLKLKLEWQTNPAEKMHIGICEDLPDAYCQFKVIEENKDEFYIIPPTLIHETTFNKLPARDIEFAKDFCQDFLNVNTAIIVRRQIENMKGSGANTQMNLRYYQDFLDKIEHMKREFEKRERDKFKK